MKLQLLLDNSGLTLLVLLLGPVLPILVAAVFLPLLAGVPLPPPPPPPPLLLFFFLFLV